jgi:hypothetical protein
MFKNVSRIVATLLVLGTLTIGATQASAAEGKFGGPGLSFWGWLSSWFEGGLMSPWEGSGMDPDGASSGDEGSSMDPDGFVVDEGSGMDPNG